MGATNNTKSYSISYGLSAVSLDLNNELKQERQKAARPTMSALPKRDISPAARRISMESYDPCIVKTVKE